MNDLEDVKQALERYAAAPTFYPDWRQLTGDPMSFRAYVRVRPSNEVVWSCPHNHRRRGPVRGDAFAQRCAEKAVRRLERSWQKAAESEIEKFWYQPKREEMSEWFSVQKVEPAEVTEEYIEDLRRRGAEEIAGLLVKVREGGGDH